jgi:hypothetical protein
MFASSVSPSGFSKTHLSAWLGMAVLLLEGELVLNPGDEAPDFVGRDHNGQTVKLADLEGKKDYSVREVEEERTTAPRSPKRCAHLSIQPVTSSSWARGSMIDIAVI